MKNGDPGELALGDIGFVGYKTDYPILDLLGLVAPVIAKVPGGYTQKIGPEYRQRFFDVAPTYALIISSNNDCQHPSVPGSQVLYRDSRFRALYDLAGKVSIDGGFAWCVFRNKNAPRCPGPRPPEPEPNSGAQASPAQRREKNAQTFERSGMPIATSSLNAPLPSREAARSRS